MHDTSFVQIIQNKHADVAIRAATRFPKGYWHPHERNGKIMYPHADHGVQLFEYRVGHCFDLFDAVRAQLAMACPLFNPFENDIDARNLAFAHTAKRSGATLFLAHTSLADSRVTNLVGECSGTREVVHEKQYPLLIISFAEAKKLPLHMLAHLRRLGLENGSDAIAPYAHTIRVSRITF